MCGRIALYSDTPQLARLLDAGVDPDLVDALEPRWNIGPTSPILGVSEDQERQRTLGAYRWGLIPWWAKDPAAIKNTFNARGETVATKSMFQSAFSRSRILVPVDAFYEWKAGTPKQPFAFKRADGQPLVFAGLRDRWKGDDGIELRSATIITTHAGPDIPIHDRQPVVLEPETWNQWLDPQVTDPDGLEPLLVPSPAGTLVHYAVGRAVGNIKNDRPELLLPKEEEEAVQGSLL
jgi:putative SOS response-associated peptidase YedK